MLFFVSLGVVSFTTFWLLLEADDAMPLARVHNSRSHVGGVAMLSMGGLSAESAHAASDKQALAATPEDLSVEGLVARYGGEDPAF